MEESQLIPLPKKNSFILRKGSRVISKYSKECGIIININRNRKLCSVRFLDGSIHNYFEEDLKLIK